MSSLEPKFLRSPPPFHFLLYWSAVVAVCGFQFLPGILPILAILPMIIVGHGAHEAVHSTLVPHGLRRGVVEKASQWIGFAILGQNFILMRWSHRQHHKSGRRRSEDTIEQAPYIHRRFGTFYYYCLLFGAAAVYHEIAGYLYPSVGEKYHILSRQFRSKYYRNPEYLVGQLLVLFVNIALYAIGGWKFILVKLIFLVYWGMGQNVAHYGLYVEDSWKGQVASRTYRGPKWLESLVFGAGFYHLEHHLFPNFPGPLLGQKYISTHAEAKLGKEYVTASLMDYCRDYFGQLKGPVKYANPEARYGTAP